MFLDYGDLKAETQSKVIADDSEPRGHICAGANDVHKEIYWQRLLEVFEDGAEYGRPAQRR